MEPFFQNVCRAGQADKEGSRGRGQQGDGGDLQAGGEVVKHGAGDTHTQAGNQRTDHIPAADLGRLGNLVVAVHKVLHLTGGSYKNLCRLILSLTDGGQIGSFAQGVHLAHFRAAAVQGVKQREDYLQGKGCAARYSQLLQAEKSVHSAYKEGKQQ